MPESGGRKDDRIEDIEEARSDEMRGELESGRGSTQSSAPFSSVLTALSICIVDWADELAGSKACVP